MASISISQKGDTRFIAKISVEQEEQAAAEKEALRKVSQKKKVAGFRKGKVPEHILRSKFAAEIADETLQSALRNKLPDIAESSEHGLYQIIGIENLKMKKDSLAFDLQFDCNPYVKVGKLKGVTLREHIPVIKAEDIDTEVKGLRRRHAEITEKDNTEDPAVASGDLVVLDFEVWVNDIPQGNPVSNQQFVVGEGELEEMVEKELLNGPKKKGDEFTVKKEFSAEEKEQRNKNKKEGEAEATHYDLIVKVKDVKDFKYPEINDEFLKKIDEKFATIEDLKAAIEKDLEKNFKRRNIDTEINKATEEVLKTAEVYFPENYLEENMQKYLAERKVDINSISEQERNDFKENFTGHQKRKILVEYFITEAAKDKKGESNYRQLFHDFLEEEYNHEMAHAMLNAYDAMLKNHRLDQTMNYLLERALGQFHQHLIETYFREAGVIKKGDKIPVQELLKQQPPG